MLNNQKENKEFLGKEEMNADFVKEANGGEASVSPKAVQSAQISGLNHVDTSRNKNEKGQCLEACIAMWVNRAIGRNLNADDVYNDMETFGNQQSPVLLPQNVPADRMLQEYYHCGPCARYTALSPNQVLKQLQWGKPVIMYISNASLKHSVIVKGISINEKDITYIIDDPNCGTGSITQSTAAGTAKSKINNYTSTYTYSDGSKSYFTYDTWYATISSSIW